MSHILPFPDIPLRSEVIYVQVKGQLLFQSREDEGAVQQQEAAPFDMPQTTAGLMSHIN